MNQRKAQALRRAAIATAKRFPDVHSQVTYQDIVRQTTQEFEVLDENIVQKGMRYLGRMLGKRSRPKTKKIEKVIHETRQTVLASGWKFILRRMKATLRRSSGAFEPNGARL